MVFSCFYKPVAFLNIAFEFEKASMLNICRSSTTMLVHINFKLCLPQYKGKPVANSKLRNYLAYNRNVGENQVSYEDLLLFQPSLQPLNFERKKQLDREKFGQKIASKIQPSRHRQENQSLKYKDGGNTT